MLIQTEGTDLKRLFLHNRSIPDARAYGEILELEEEWIVPLVRAAEASAPRLSSREEVVEAMNELLAVEKQSPSPNLEYLAREATLEQFKVIVSEFAVDGLTEAQSFFPAIPRLPLRAQMAVLRVMIDEFGCGRVEQAHSQLYRDLLTELGMPLDPEAYLDALNDESYAFLNVFYWMAGRAPDIECFLGALGYLEASIPFVFSWYADACSRLGIRADRYYTEHIHIDSFHMQEMQIAIRELETARGLDPTKVWVGIKLASDIVGEAFDAAVVKAREAADR